MAQASWAARVGWSQDAVGERSSSDSLDEAGLALWQAGNPRRNWRALNMPDSSRGHVRVPGQEDGWAPRLGAPAAAQSPRPSLPSAPTSSAQWGPCSASDCCVFGGFPGGSDGEEATRQIFNIVHWNTGFKLERRIEEVAVLPRGSYT